jgi:hypothetical protein
VGKVGKKIVSPMTGRELDRRYSDDTALTLSIEKWERLGYKKNWPFLLTEDLRSDSCGLCKKYGGRIFNCFDIKGESCPLKDQHTYGCGPGSQWQKALIALEGINRPAFMAARYNILRKMRRALVKEEAQFLKEQRS